MLIANDESPIIAPNGGATAGQGINESDPRLASPSAPSINPVGRASINPAGPQLVGPGGRSDPSGFVVTTPPQQTSPSTPSPDDGTDDPATQPQQPIVYPSSGGSVGEAPTASSTNNLSGVVDALGGLLGGSSSSGGGDPTPTVQTAEVPVVTDTSSGSGAKLVIVLIVLVLGGAGWYGYKHGWFGKHGGS